MKSFTKEDIIQYYDLTKVHYQRAWDLSESRSMHYGFKNKSSDSFRDSLQNMNWAMADYVGINKHDRVLDAGCGIGGSSFFLANEYACKVTGISLSKDQIEEARVHLEELKLEELEFMVADFTDLPFEDSSFDVIWALESLVHCENKQNFFKEANRVLKPGGKIILGEYLRNNRSYSKKEEALLTKWLNAWAIKEIDYISDYEKLVLNLGYNAIKHKNITENIRYSSWRMFYGSWFLFVLSKLYKIYNPNVTQFADQHYKGLYYQYLCLRQNLWSYWLICIEK